MFESCLEIRSCFSEYLDGECSPDTRRSLRYHLQYCAACRRELERYELIQSDLHDLPRPRPSAFAQLRLAVALSRARHAQTLANLSLRLENALQPLLLPASGAVLAGLLCLSLTFNWLIPPGPSKPDVPLVTPPRLESMAPLDFKSGDVHLVVMTNVDAGGHVVDYQVLSGQQSPELKPELDRLMYFSIFQPATLFGQPTAGRAVLSLSRITVRGSGGHSADGAKAASTSRNPV